MEGELDDVFSRCRLDPTDLEAVTYFLPRLLSGETMHGGADRVIHHVDIYAFEPKDLAAAFPPAPQAVQSGDRFFFTTCKRLKWRGNRSVRGAGDGRWNINTTKDIKDRTGVKVGEIKKLSFVSNSTGKATGWVMEEYRCLLPEAVVADGDKVLCKIHLAPSACDAARQESAAYKRRQESESAARAAQAPKRPAPVAADPPSPKKMRVAVPTMVAQQGFSDSEAFATPPPACLPAMSTKTGAAVAEADDDYMDDRYTCTMDELLGGRGVQEEEEIPVESEDDNDEYSPSIEELLSWMEEDNKKLPVADDEQMLPAVDNEQSKQLTTGELMEPFDPDSMELLNDRLEFTCFEPTFTALRA